MKRWIVVLAVCIMAGQAQTGTASSASPRCTPAELDTLQIPIGFDGWTELNLKSLAVADTELHRACAKVPARWRWVNRGFNRSTLLVDRLYPGAWQGAWARRCASSEGGHGGWVPNRQGSGAGGWLQFMSGTFYGVIDAAYARARGHGVRVPGWARSWYSPLGQALAGSEMLWRGRRSEWTGSTC